MQCCIRVMVLVLPQPALLVLVLELAQREAGGGEAVMQAGQSTAGVNAHVAAPFPQTQQHALLGLHEEAAAILCV